MSAVHYPHITVEGGRYIEPPGYSAPLLPDCVNPKDLPHNVAIDSAMQGTAFLALKNALDRQSGSTLAALEALYEHGTKVDGERAWFIENRFGVDLYVVPCQEIYRDGKFRVPLSIGIKCDEGCVMPAREWLTVCIGLN